MNTLKTSNILKVVDFSQLCSNKIITTRLPGTAGYRLCGRRPTTPCSVLATEEQLESVLQGRHVRIGVLVELESVGNDLDVPSARSSLVARTIAEVEVSGVLWHSTEGVHEATRIGLTVCFEPLF